MHNPNDKEGLKKEKGQICPKLCYVTYGQPLNIQHFAKGFQQKTINSKMCCSILESNFISPELYC